MLHDGLKSNCLLFLVKTLFRKRHRTPAGPKGRTEKSTSPVLSPKATQSAAPLGGISGRTLHQVWAVCIQWIHAVSGHLPSLYVRLSNASQPKISRLSFCCLSEQCRRTEKQFHKKKKKKTETRWGRKWDQGLFLDNPFNCAFH